jgi:hypothetical protein
MKYCEETTRNHPIAVKYNTFLESLEHLIRREGYSNPANLFINGEIVLDLDQTEKFVAEVEGRLPNKSMDFAMGIKNHSATRRSILLVELRLNYNNPNNLDRKEIVGKVEGSVNLLSPYIPVYGEYIFIFRTEKIQEAISRLFRMIPKINSQFIVMDIDTLKKEYFS